MHCSSFHYILHCPAKIHLSFWFKSANCTVMIWSCFSWSGLGTASQQSSWMYWMTRLFFLTWWLGPIPGQQCQDSSGSSCDRVEHEDTWVSGSTRSHFHKWIGHHRVLTLTLERLWHVLEKTEGIVWLSCHQYKISAKNECNSGWK